MLNKFISGLSATEKKILSVAMVFVLLALFDRLLIGPSLARLSDIDDKIVKEESVVKQNLRYLTHRDRILKEAAVFKDYYAKDARAEEEIIGEFLKKIELMATQSQVELSKIAPAGQDYQKDYVKYLVTLDCAGKLEDITYFMYAVNNSSDLLKIEKMNLLNNTRDVGKVQASLTISRMIIGADPAVGPKNLVKASQDQSSATPAPVTAAPAAPAK